MQNGEYSTRRSDRIRERRTERVRKVVLPTSGPTRGSKSSRKRTFRAEAASAPPVMVRRTSAPRSMAAPPSGGRRRSSTRQRYDVALGMPGVEVRLPSLPHVSFSWRYVSFLLVSALAFLAYQFWNSPAYRVDEVQIYGLQRVSSREVSSLVDVAGEPIFTVSPGEMESNLMESFPEFSAVDVKVALPASVAITVTERVPVLSWVQMGQPVLVDSEGVAFPLRADHAIPPVVVEASGPPPSLQPQASQRNSEAVLENVEKGAAAKPQLAQPGLPAAGEPFLSAEMVQGILTLSPQAPSGASLAWDAQHGFGWRDPGGWQVYFGDGKDMDMKLQVYAAILRRLDAADTMPAMISVEYVHTPYFRTE